MEGTLAPAITIKDDFFSNYNACKMHSLEYRREVPYWIHRLPREELDHPGLSYEAGSFGSRFMSKSGSEFGSGR